MRPTRWLTGLLTVVLFAALPVAQAAARGSSKPSVGECRHLSAKQAGALSNGASPTPCSAAHNARVIAVPTLPKGVLWTDLSQRQILRLAIKKCTPGFQDALGRNDLVRDRTAYSWVYFIPTAQERTDGARWFRCDLVLFHGAKFADLPTDHEPALSHHKIPTNVKRCLGGKDLLVTTCAFAHRYRATGSFVIKSPQFPGRQEIVRVGRATCPTYVSTDRDYRFTYSAKVQWNLAHNHVVVCFSRSST